MPLYDFCCTEGHTEEHYLHAADDLGCLTHMCQRCKSSDVETPMFPIPSFGAGLTWFSESSGRWVSNLGVDPVYITSHEQHKAEMKKAGVEWATGWQINGTKGWV